MPETITLKQFAGEIAQERNMPIGHTQAMVQAMLDKIDEHLQRRDKVQFTGWGAFELRERPARPGRNPRTGETIQIEAHTTPHFDVSSKWRDRMTQAMSPKVTKRKRKAAPKAEAQAATPKVTRRNLRKPAEAPTPAVDERQQITAEMQALKTQIDRLQDLSMQRAIEGKDLTKRDQDKLMKLQSQWGQLSDKLRAMGPAKRARRKEAAIA